MRNFNSLEIIPTILLFLALVFVMYIFFNFGQSMAEQERVYKELKDDEIIHKERLLKLRKERDSLLDIRDSLRIRLEEIRNLHN